MSATANGDVWDLPTTRPQGPGGRYQHPGHELETSQPARVWVVLLWGGFRTGDDDGRSFQRLLMREYVETDHLFFGRY